MVKFVVVHRRDANNVGDMASNPLQYFLNNDEYQVVDAADFGREHYPLDVPLVLGGGGLLGNEFIGNIAEKVLSTPDRLQLDQLASVKWHLVDDTQQNLHKKFKNSYTELVKEIRDKLPTSSAPKYIWGAGHNGNDNLEYPEALTRFNRVGIRDFGQTYDWVPCASCMHPAFDKQYSVRNPVIWFEHKKQLIKSKAFGDEPIPRFINSGTNFEQTIELLGSAEVVLTNSYHGAYWATLLGRKAVVVGAWSTKFQHMKHTPAFTTTDQNWRDVIDQATVYGYALDECREANENFWKSIQ